MSDESGTEFVRSVMEQEKCLHEDAESFRFMVETTHSLFEASHGNVEPLSHQLSEIFKK